jgi:uncharacterized protein YndB with AHSA1/START domain
MQARVEKRFAVPLPVGRVWRAFAETRERSQWEADPFEIEARPGGRVHWRLPGVECEGRVLEVVPERLLRHSEGSGPHQTTEVCVRLEPTEIGTQVTISHDGLGEGEEGAWAAASVDAGWSLALADLHVWLERGVPARRFVRRWLDPGFRGPETAAGLVVGHVEPGGFAEGAGLRPGDLLLAVGGAPVTTHRELWALLKAHGPGAQLGVEYLRGRERGSGVGALGGG